MRTRVRVVGRCMECFRFEINFTVKLMECILLLKSRSIVVFAAAAASMNVIFILYYFLALSLLSLKTQRCKCIYGPCRCNPRHCAISKLLPWHCTAIIKTFAIIKPLTWHWLLAANSGTVYLYTSIQSTIYKRRWYRMAMVHHQQQQQQLTGSNNK